MEGTHKIGATRMLQFHPNTANPLTMRNQELKSKNCLILLPLFLECSIKECKEQKAPCAWQTYRHGNVHTAFRACAWAQRGKCAFRSLEKTSCIDKNTCHFFAMCISTKYRKFPNPKQGSEIPSLLISVSWTLMTGAGPCTLHTPMLRALIYWISP